MLFIKSLVRFNYDYRLGYVTVVGVVWVYFGLLFRKVKWEKNGEK